MKLKILALVGLIVGGVMGVSVLATDVNAASVALPAGGGGGGGSASAASQCPDGSLNPTYSTSLAECNIPANAPGTEKKLTERVVDIINVVVGIVGVIAVVAVVFGGVLFVTSTGDAAKVTRAKNTIIYGIVGLVVALLAFAIVSFISGAIFSPGSVGTSSSNSSSNSQQSTGTGN